LILGSGDYQIALEVQDANHQTQELYPNWFSFLINYTNDFDPPLFHIPGEWQFENEATQVTAARISSYQ
jgi:hypothetical protein